MKKKIFDITPPQKEQIEELQPIESRPALHQAKAPALKEKTVKKQVSAKKLATLFVGLAFLLGAVLSYFLIPHKAEIEIWPKMENVTEEVQALVALAGDSENYLPGEILEIEKTVSQNFTVQGTALKAVKAHGIIRVYNNYSAASQSLVATTRFVSDDGKLFRTPKKVVIPGSHYEGGKLVPGFVDIEVVADQPGEEYNIDPSTFSIPGFAGTSKYTAFYAKSSEPMKDGFKKEVHKVSQGDLDKAREALEKAALYEGRASLKDSVSSKGYILIEEAVAGKIVDFKPEVKVDQEVDNFSAEAQVSFRAVVFKESELKKFAREYLQNKITDGKKILESSIKTEYSLEKADLEKNELSLKITISARSHFLPEEAQIKEMIRNKSVEDVQKAFKGLTFVEKVDIKLWPFWANSAPEDTDRIKVVVRLD